MPLASSGSIGATGVTAILSTGFSCLPLKGVNVSGPKANPLDELIESRNPAREIRIGLALSGGGFRATLFHLGVIEYLRNADLLQHVSTLTSVSGGSILAAHLALNWQAYLDHEIDDAAEDILEFVGMDIRGRIVRRLLPRFSTTKRLQRHYRSLFQAQRKKKFLEEISGGPELHLLSTNLEMACVTSFSSNGVFLDALQDEVPLNGTKTEIDFAVAASSAFPLLFSPLRMEPDDIRVSSKTFQHRRISLTDGGVFDNSGGRMLRRLAKENSLDLLIVSEAGSKIDWQDGPYRWASANLRAVEMFQARICEWERDELVNGDVPSLIIDIGDGAFSKVRTDLDAFSEQEIKAIRKYGYSVAKTACANHGAAFSGLINQGMRYDRPDPVIDENYVDGSNHRAWGDYFLGATGFLGFIVPCSF